MTISAYFDFERGIEMPAENVTDVDVLPAAMRGTDPGTSRRAHEDTTAAGVSEPAPSHHLDNSPRTCKSPTCARLPPTPLEIAD